MTPPWLKLIAIFSKHVYNNTNKAKIQLLVTFNFCEVYMKFLHTADWHLGVKTNGRDRIDEQKRVLDEIVSIANFENIDCVIIAGDVFNTASPSAEAEELFFDTIERLSNGGDRFVFVLAGNHDDPTRLSAGLPLAGKHNIALVSSLDRLKENSFLSSSLVRVVETGKGYLKIKKNEEIVTIAYLPYPSESRISEKVDGELSYAEKVREWANISASVFRDDTFNIFVSHLFMVGSKTNDDVVKVGDIMAVPKNMLPKADYTALGHIHTPQDLGGGVNYAGAITALSVNQSGLGVVVFETENNKLISKNIQVLQNTAKYEKVKVSSISEAEDVLLGYDDKDIVELEIEQNEPLSASELKTLKKNFPCISNISLVRIYGNEEVKKTVSRKHLSDEALFKEFYKQVRNTEPSDELMKLFVECKGGEHEAD